MPVAPILPYDTYVMSRAPVTEGTAGALYRLCWGHSPSVNTDYSFEVGIFALNGPLVLTEQPRQLRQYEVLVAEFAIGHGPKIRVPQIIEEVAKPH